MLVLVSVCPWWAATLLTDDGFKKALKNLSLCFSQHWESQLSLQMKARVSLAVVGPWALGLMLLVCEVL